MNVELSYDKEFSDLLNNLKDKYGAAIFELEGIGSQLDLNKFSKEFFSTKVTADTSIDDNSNVGDSSVISYTIELTKPYEKLNSLYLLWKEMRRLYHTDVSNNLIEMYISGDLYIHDFHSINRFYCYNYSTYDIMNKGLPMVTKIKSLPPKYLYSFKSQLEQFIVIAANSSNGASGVADTLLVMSYYVKNIVNTLKDGHFKFAGEDDVWAYVKETLVSLIYTVNQPFRAGHQSPFVNISIFDKYFIEDLSDMYIFEDGSTLDINIINKLQDIYLDIMNEEMRRTPVTFPVTTACFSIDDNREFKDPDFVKYIIEKNEEFGFINLYSGKSTTLSSCCFTGDQQVLTKSSAGAKLCAIDEVCNGDYAEYRKNFTVFHNGSWVKSKPVKVTYKDDLYKITTYNNKEIIVTKDHIHLTDSGDLLTTELSTNDYLAFNTRSLDTYPEANDMLTYEQGYFIGMFIGDGSYDKDSSIIFSLNMDKVKAIDIICKAIRDWNINYTPNVTADKHNVYFIKIHNKELVNKIQSFISGRTAITKQLNDYIFTQSKEFRKGIIDGWYWTDGGNSNRIYSVNKSLIDSGEAICTTLGIQTIINISDRTNEPVIIRGETYKRNYPLYCLKLYSPANKRVISNWFKVVNNTEYFKIKSIDIIERLSDDVYCFEVSSDEPYFTLPNGIITHNCRLRSDMETIGYANSIGGSSTKIGSVGVTTINMYRLARKSKNVNEFKTYLAEMVGACARINHARRTIIRKKIERGFAPLYTYDFVSLDKQFSTCGINGFYEAMCELGIDITSEAGLKAAIDIMDVINTENKKYDKSFGYQHNVEQVPGESLSVKIAAKDKLLGYNTEYELYSNQFIPLTASADILERIKIQGALDSHFSGGSIMHLNFDQRINDANKIYNILLEAVKQGVVYMAINYILNECENGHMSVGDIEMCSTCGGKFIGKYTRIVGYLSNVKNWNKTRRSVDFPNRKFYEVKS